MGGQRLFFEVSLSFVSAYYSEEHILNLSKLNGL